MQAQQDLHLSDDQFAKFLARVKALQDIRRRGQMQRGRMLQELRRLSQQDGSDDAAARDAEVDRPISISERRSMCGRRSTAVDQVLDVHQQARFRLFEEQMERRKVELLMRARQANRQQKNQF